MYGEDDVYVWGKRLVIFRSVGFEVFVGYLVVVLVGWKYGFGIVERLGLKVVLWEVLV